MTDEQARQANGLYRAAGPLRALILARAAEGRSLSTLERGPAEALADYATEIGPLPDDSAARELQLAAIDLAEYVDSMAEAGTNLAFPNTFASAVLSSYEQLSAELREPDLHLLIEIFVQDFDSLCEYVNDRREPAGNDDAFIGLNPELVVAGTVCFDDPAEFGVSYTLTKATLAEEADAGEDTVPRFWVELRATVTDPAKLLAYAHQRYVACWADESWNPANLGEALFEAAYASNTADSPYQLGIETGHHEFHLLTGMAGR